jgi:hypothetical protein
MDTVTQPEPDLHVMPTDKDHAESSDCWCEPELNYINPTTGRKVWVHREFH